MNAKEFLNAVTNGEGDVVELLLALLRENETQYCAIGGLAVNAYVEPVVSLDLDVVVVADKLAEISDRAEKKGFRVCKEDVLQGKLWAYEDKTRRGSKRQKDLADILRLVEDYPELAELLPESLRGIVE